MKPPKCTVCGEIKDCEIVRFKITKLDAEEEDEHSLEGWVGHPHYLLWFCKKHVEIAKKHIDLNSREATKKIKKEVDK